MALKITRTSCEGRDLAGRDTLLIADGMIAIKVDKVSGKQVHLSIDAPRDIDIVRAELARIMHATPSAQGEP